jgi:outer membrane receptor protein involved in Fe transport
MIKDPHTRLLVRRLCGAALAVNACGLSVAVAQQAGAAPALEGEPIQMEKIIVTGSLLPTAETVGPAPVDMIEAETIQRIGSQDVLQILQKLTPSFQGNANIGQTVNNGGNGEANVALRNLNTLVLLDGKRLANSTFSSGTAVDVNTIPISMIDRVEILKDGASAIYGSDAIGGVVNIITKKNYNGAEFSGRYGFATGEGHTAEYRASIVAGSSNERTSIVAGGQYYYMEPLLSGDREVASEDVFGMLERGLYAPSYISPFYPGLVWDDVGYVLAGSPFAQGHPDYNPTLIRPPVQPGVSYTTIAAYRAANPGVYIPISETPIGVALDAAGQNFDPFWQLLNTPLLGTYSIQEQERISAWFNLNHELFGKRMEFYSSFLFANNHSQAQLAPSPVPFLTLYDITIPANSPVNPFQITLGHLGATPPQVSSRFVQSGNRIYDSQTDYYRIVTGLKGEWENGWGYDAAYNYNRSEQVEFTRNAINGAVLNQVMAPNPDPALAAQGLSGYQFGNDYVPVFNIFALGGNAQSTLDALRATLFESGTSELWSADMVLRGTPVDLPAGPLGFAAGGAFYTESLELDRDGLTSAGLVPGSNQSLPFPGGKRDSWGFFAEFAVPIFSTDNNVPAFYGLQANVAVRHEQIDPGGSATVPKLGLKWQPVSDDFTLRGSYSQGFIAPSIFDLFGAPQASVPSLILPTSPTDPTPASIQQSVNYVSNPELKPAHSENFSGGIVLSPKAVEGLSLSLDYYNIKVDRQSFTLSEQTMAGDLVSNGYASEFARYFTYNDGTKLTPGSPQVAHSNWGILDVPLANGAEQETDGLDISLIYRRPLENCGTMTLFVNANVLFSYTYQDPVSGGPYNYEGQYTDDAQGVAGANGTLPDYVIIPGLSWEYKDFTYAVSAKYIPEVTDLGYLHPAAYEGYHGFTLDDQEWTIPAYFTIDMQLAYEIGRNREEKRWFDGTRLAVGVNNITDEEPPFIASAFEDNTDKATYDILGRFVYFEVAKKF